MKSSREECCSGWPFSSPGHLPDSGIEPGSTVLQADSLPTEPPGTSYFCPRTCPQRLQHHCRDTGKAVTSLQETKQICGATRDWRTGSTMTQKLKGNNSGDRFYKLSSSLWYISFSCHFISHFLDHKSLHFLASKEGLIYKMKENLGL